ncbi:molecular chaperone HtpG [Phototrophicus methaneseepsis]|uniref:Chaperone protein HtpG n=1 Tax=Phototrophicus methaneseepsis TaxID=2710758 RepID=A0A7S8ED19_9CHLR|nr:molecular chaperone HtpG [Phototrophicus methaneseepsis]QPC84701.1 molecular chaperone HtpG [Phototrophicus methaneseepsis]
MSEMFTFQAETQQLLDILIHSLYTEREIFLRELLSNASDALNRMQFTQLTESDVLDPEAELKITITSDEEAGTMTISDTGIGMTREEVIENLGTIARSGAKNFIQALKDAPNSEAAQNIIGQFGVGFYSVFMAADTVQVVTRSYKPDAEAVMWEADGGTAYSIEPAHKETRGTDIIIKLKDDAKEFASPWKIKDIIRRHSDYIAFPIYVGDDEDPTNKQTAIWRKSPSEVTDEEYDAFYKQFTLDFGEPLHRIHMRADVPMQFYALLFIPSTAQQNMFSPRKEPGLALYSRKILIDEYNNDLLPEYLQFVQGVVDSEDLPLNVSRESVKADRIIARLKGTLTKRIMSDLKKMAANEPDDYLSIYEEFGRYLKQGVVAAPQDKDDLMELLLFQSTHDDDVDEYISLQGYVDRMVEGQNEIYYVVADDFSTARRSPHLEPFRQRGIEVLYFSDPVDAMLPMGLTDYKGHSFRAVDEADIDLTDVGTPKEDENQPEPLESSSTETLIDRVKSVLGSRVSDVRMSKTLVGSPARLISQENGGTRHMFRINRLLDREYEMPVKALELNPRHPLLHNLSHMLDGNPSSPMIDLVVMQLFETALLQEGIHPDPASMAARLNMLMEAATGTAVETLDFASVLPEKEAPEAKMADVEAPEAEAFTPEPSSSPEEPDSAEEPEA